MPRLIVGRRKDSFQKFQKTKETLLTVFVITRPIELTDELKKFCAEGIATILEGTVPVVMDQEARVVVHIVPRVRWTIPAIGVYRFSYVKAKACARFTRMGGTPFGTISTDS